MIFATKYEILHAGQHGVKTGRSTQTAIVSSLIELYNYMHNTKKCLAIIMDLSEVFDLVDHDLIISKLYEYEFKGKFGKIVFTNCCNT